MRQVLKLEVELPAELLQRYTPNGRLGCLTFDGEVPGELGEPVELEVSTRAPARTFRTKGLLAWARHATGRGLKASFGVELLATGGGAKRLLAFAQSTLDVEATRAAPRVSVSLPVKVEHEGETRKELLADLSLGGAFIRCVIPAPVGTTLKLTFRPRLALVPVALEAKVAWVRFDGDDSGMGVAFEALTAKQRARLEKLVRAHL